MKNIVMLMVVLFLSQGCAPKTETKIWPKSRSTFGPTRSDTDIFQMLIDQNEDLKTPPLVWEDEVAPAVLFRASESLVAVGESADRDELREVSKSFSQNLMRGLPKNLIQGDFTNSFYLQLLSREASTALKPTLFELIVKISEDRDVINHAINELDQSFKLKNSGSLKGNLHLILNFVSSVKNLVSQLDIHPLVKQNLVARIHKLMSRIQDGSDQFLTETSAANTLTQVLVPIDAFLVALEIQLTAPSKLLVQQAKNLGSKIDQMKDAQGALDVVVDIWREMNAEERGQFIEPLSTKLYDYLNTRSDQNLKCLQDANCQDFEVSMAKKMAIFPEINKLGIDNMRQVINVQSKSWILVQIEQLLQKNLQGFPKSLVKNVSLQISIQLATLRRIYDNFDRVLQGRIKNWLESSFSSQQLNYFEIENTLARLNLTEENTLHLDWVDPGNLQIEGLGAYLAFLPRYWDFNLIVESATTSSQFFVIDNLAKEWLSPSPIPDSLTALSYAEIVRGYSRLIQFFNVKNKNVFDRELGSLKVSEFIPELSSSGQIEGHVFPKEELLALTLALTSVQLQAITDSDSQIFLIDDDGKVVWANKFDYSSDTQPSLVGIVDRLRGQRAKIVRSEDVSRFVLALTEFIRSTDSLGDLPSAYLQRKIANGKTALELITNTRTKLRILVIALSNYLSRQFKSKDGFILPLLDVATQKSIVDIPTRPVDQLLAIRALIEASEVIGVSLYQWEALDLYFLMNQKMFNPEIGFYGNSAVELPLLLETLRTLQSLKPYLTGTSLTQNELLAKNWQGMLKSLKMSVSSP